MKTTKNKLGTIALRMTAAAVLWAATAIQPLSAGTIQVTSTDDDGPDNLLSGTLRSALANALDDDTIDATGVTGTITLAPGLTSSAELRVDKNVTILGPGPANLRIDANHLSRLFHITTGHTVIIEGLRLVNGDATGVGPAELGGGIYNDHSSLTVNNCVLSGNSAAFRAGAIYSDGGSGGSAGLTVVNSVLDSNSAGESGGAIYNNGSFSGSATLTVDKSTLSDNSAVQGGGIFNDGNGGSAPLTVSASTLNGNSALGRGGAIFNDGRSGSAPAAVSVSTLSGNSAQSGGGILSFGSSLSATFQVANSTLSGNSASSIGGGIFIEHQTLEIGNTILRAGSPGENIIVFNLDGSVTSHGFNLSSDDGGGFLTATGDQINTDPELGPLADNGGPTRTHAPLAGSPAIDKGLSNTIGTLASDTDQRGLPRTVDDPNIGNAPFGDGTDIGAVEVAAPNHGPVAKCKNVTVLAGTGGTADASIDDGSFDPDSGDTFSVLQTPPGPYPIGTTTVTLTVTDSHGDSSSCTATVTVQGVADLAISKAVASGQAKPGQVLSYTITVSNTGPNPASGVVVNDAVPQGTTFVSASPAPSIAPAAGAVGTVTWNLPTLNSGTSATFTLTVKVSLKGNTLIVNTATVSSSSFDPNLANNTVTLTSKRNSK